jgi:hypothetical protein
MINPEDVRKFLAQEIDDLPPLDPIEPPPPSAQELFEEKVKTLTETVTHIQEVTATTNSNVDALIANLNALTDIVAKNNAIQEERWRKDSQVLDMIAEWLKRR